MNRGWTFLVATAGFLVADAMVTRQTFTGIRAEAASDASDGISADAADRFGRKLQILIDNPKSPKQTLQKPVRVTHDEINSYLALRMKGQIHPALRELQVKLQGAQAFSSQAVIDFDQIDVSNQGKVAELFVTLLSGVHTLYLEGTVEAQEGTGRVQITHARLDDVPLPSRLVRLIIRELGKKHDPPLDITEPFPLPNGIESIAIHPGYAVITG
ncbi:MAG: hypothetical protein HY652_05260 [Acidobacteria bacterium]|nr:hypothetical protein [Acidobacteriota bacterium]